jgi:hypothetical protein
MNIDLPSAPAPLLSPARGEKGDGGIREVKVADRMDAWK